MRLAGGRRFTSNTVVRLRPDDATSPLEGRGRLHTELVMLKLVGFDVTRWTPSFRFAARFFMDVLIPFALLLGVSRLTRPPSPERIDQFFGKMKTPVGETQELELAAHRGHRGQSPAALIARSFFRAPHGSLPRGTASMPSALPSAVPCREP